MKRQVFFLVLVLLLLRLPALFHPVLDVDESIYALFARIWFDGGVPYLNCVETKPLGIYFLFGVIFELFGRYNMIAVHAVTIGIIGLTSYVIYLISKLLYSEKAGFWAALFYIVFSTTYIPKVIATTIEPVMLLPVTLMFYWWLRYEREGKGWLAAASGMAFSAACLLKYQAGMNLIVLLSYLIFVKRQIRLKDAARFALGAIWLPAVMLIYLYQRGALEHFIYWNFTGNLNYINEGSASLNVGRQILTRVLPYIVSTGLLWVLVGMACFKRSILRQAQDERDTWLIILWFALSIIPVSAGLRFYGHYFLLLLPPMAILASGVAERLVQRPWPKGLIVAFIMIPAIGFGIARLYIFDVNKRFKEDNLADYAPLAKYISLNTKPSDRILSWGYAPLIYWYSERLPAIRFFWSDLLTGRIPGTKGEITDKTGEFVHPEAWKMFMDDMAANRPVYIVDTAPANLHDYANFPVTKFPELWSYMQAHYKEELRLNGSVFYRRMD